MDSQTIFAQLRDALAELYPEEQDAHVILSDAGVDARRITFSARTRTNWHNILTETIRQNRLNPLLEIVHKDYPDDRAFLNAYTAYLQHGSQIKPSIPLPTKTSHRTVVSKVWWIIAGVLLAIVVVILWRLNFIEKPETASTNTPTSMSIPVSSANTPTILVDTAKSITPTAVSEAEITVNSDKANIRQGPGTNYPLLGVTDSGQHYRVRGKNPTGDWWQIDYKGQQGWIFGLLVTGQNTETVTVASNIPPSPIPPIGTSVPTSTSAPMPTNISVAITPQSTSTDTPSPTSTEIACSIPVATYKLIVPQGTALWVDARRECSMAKDDDRPADCLRGGNDMHIVLLGSFSAGKYYVYSNEEMPVDIRDYYSRPPWTIKFFWREPPGFFRDSNGVFTVAPDKNRLVLNDSTTNNPLSISDFAPSFFGDGVKDAKFQEECSTNNYSIISVVGYVNGPNLQDAIKK